MEPIVELQNLMSPPQHPVGNVGDWDAIEKKLGTRLPDDYKEFVRLYGEGGIGEMPICVSSPFSQINNLQQHIDGTTGAYQLLFKSWGVAPFPIFPEKGGLLAWGNTGNGDYMNWLTNGKPNKWSVVVWHSAKADFLRFDMGLVEFLAEAVSLRLRVFPASFLKPPLIFSSSKPVRADAT